MIDFFGDKMEDFHAADDFERQRGPVGNNDRHVIFARLGPAPKASRRQVPRCSSSANTSADRSWHLPAARQKFAHLLCVGSVSGRRRDPRRRFPGLAGAISLSSFRFLLFSGLPRLSLAASWFQVRHGRLIEGAVRSSAVDSHRTPSSNRAAPRHRPWPLRFVVRGRAIDRIGPSCIAL